MIKRNGIYYDWRHPNPDWYIWGQKEKGPVDHLTYRPEESSDELDDLLLASYNLVSPK